MLGARAAAWNERRKDRPAAGAVKAAPKQLPPLPVLTARQQAVSAGLLPAPTPRPTADEPDDPPLPLPQAAE
jgi:hypothetical protein